ncbi:DUF7310 family coiled-coil domain-containing protein [Natrarchaeobaculum sulfurireducens]|uniref:Pilin/flagellin, contains class III signal peptide n=1 Tax=Natrarchaeobaculum sulfurireducens TaxID=2044521 RepID=A0A346PFM9_9EURY|nr:hypothetical protein [Natrarchaeobaculum sulfurireducens]AXR78324.1 Pilin/flagellin, contains class III signal peptide [Natrarchaeobaculum sulfurireducens]AXR81645.1 hypothetical protein AArcMg_1633 [Natrarchaeobaculum sulfurireducens]
MTDIDRLDQRLAAVERVVVDGDVTLEGLSELTSVVEAVAELESRLEEQEGRLADLEASVQSVEGYVGTIESVNDDVERHAASAIATVDRLERRIDTLEVELDDLQDGLLEDEPTAQSGGDRGEDGGREETGSDDSDGDGDGDGDSRNQTAGDGSTVFEFRSSDENPSPERLVGEIVGSEPRSFVDDGVERPVSSANQMAVDSAINEGEPSTTDADGDTDADDGSLLGSLRSRLS